MARAPMAAVARDRGGNVIANALIRVYLEGTTTPVSDMYAAETGGTAVTTLTSDVEGQIAAWFDTPKLVDLVVTDNGNAAYSPGAVGTLDFDDDTPITVTVSPRPEEIAQLDETQTWTAAQTFPTIHVDGVTARAPWVDVTHPDFGAVGDGAANDLAALQAADVVAAAAGAGLFFPPGDYRVDTQFTPTCSFLHFATGAALLAGADIVPLRIGSACDVLTDITTPDVGVAAGVAHTTDLVLVQARLNVVGTLVADGAGRHGVYFKMDAGDNLNWVTGQFRGTNCGGDGVRVENASGGVGNLNAWNVLLRGDDCNVGVRVLDGIGGYYRIAADSCTAEGAKVGGGTEGVNNATVVLYDDSSNGAVPTFAGSGVVFGLFNNGVPIKAGDGWLVANRDVFEARSTGAGRRAFAIANTSANDAAEWADLDMVTEAGVVGRLRVRGDGFIVLRDMADLLLSPTRLGVFSVTPVARAAATDDIKDALTAYGWLQGTSATPLNLDGGKATVGEAEIDGALNHDGTTVGFYGVTPATRPGATDDVKDALTLLGLLQGTSASPLNLDGGALTAGAGTFTGRVVASTITTFADLDATPSVSAGNVFKTANSGATTVTTFDDGVAGQEILVIFGDANTTVDESGNIRLSAAFTSTADDTMRLVSDGTNWFELSRSVN